MRKNPGFKEDQRWFEQHLPELLERYPGEYVAIVGKQVVFHHHDFAVLSDHVYRRYDLRPIAMARVEKPWVPAVLPAAS